MGQLVSGYLDFAERQAEREQAVDKATGEYKKNITSEHSARWEKTT